MPVLEGRYQLLEPIGQGGMAVVWRALDLRLHRDVAVKVVAPHLDADPSTREGFRQEAHAAAQLCHPNVATVYDYGETELDGRHRVPFIVMEYVEGATLQAELRHGRLPWPVAVRVCGDVAAALAAAHALGLVHRDVKPANVMLTAGVAKVVDFGIAAAIGGPQADQDGIILATPVYAAPEQLCGRPVQSASDVYALGLLLYQCLTGTLPWLGAGPAEILEARQTRPPSPLPMIRGLPDAVVEACRNCLAEDPHERRSSHQIAVVLRAAARLDGCPAEPMDRASIVATAVPPVLPRRRQGYAVGATATTRSRRRRRTAVFAGATLVTLTAILMGHLSTVSAAPERSSDPSGVVTAPASAGRVDATQTPTRMPDLPATTTPGPRSRTSPHGKVPPSTRAIPTPTDMPSPAPSRPATSSSPSPDSDPDPTPSPSTTRIPPSGSAAPRSSAPASLPVPSPRV